MNTIFRQTIIVILIAILALTMVQNVMAAKEKGAPIGEYEGVKALSNGVDTETGTDLRYQCVEYVKRFYLEVMNMDTGKWSGNANTYYNTASEKGLDAYENGGAMPPQPGDILAFSGGKQGYGHVAIITEVGNDYVKIIEQNWNRDSAIHDLTKEGNTIQNTRSGYTIQGWLRKPGPHILDQSITPTVVTSGDEMTFVFNINNPYSYNIENVRLGAQIRAHDPQGTWIDDYSNDEVVTLLPGAHDYKRHFVISEFINSEFYDANWVILDNNTEIWYDSKEMTRIFEVITSDHDSFIDKLTKIGQETIDSLKAYVNGISGKPVETPPKDGATSPLPDQTIVDKIKLWIEENIPMAGSSATDTEPTVPSQISTKPTVDNPKWTGDFNDDTRQMVLARAIYGEARGETKDGKIAVGWVIKNRAEHPRWWGDSYHSVILKPKQFSAFNENDNNRQLVEEPLLDKNWYESYEVANQIINNQINDLTGGADHYYSISISPPDWADETKFTTQIGNHRFYRLEITDVDPIITTVPQITSITPTKIEGSTFDLTIIGNNFDTSAIDQIFWKADGKFVGQGTILSQTSTKIVVKQFMTGAEGAYVVKVKNADEQLSNGVDLTITAPTIEPTPIVKNGKKIGIQPGHWKNDSGAIGCDGKTREVDINLAVANLAADLLRQRGYEVDVLAATDSAMQGYKADAFVALHVDFCAGKNTGFKVARKDGTKTTGKIGNNDYSDKLVDSLWLNYGAVTGLVRDPNHITDNMIKYYVFNLIEKNTPSAIIEMGWLSGDFKLITSSGGQNKMALGIADSVDKFLNSATPTTSAPQITSITPTQITASTFDLTIYGNNFDTSAVDQIFWKADGHLVGQGTILSQTSTQIVVRQFMTGAEGVYVVKVKNADSQLSDGVDLTVTSPTISAPQITSITPAKTTAGDFDLTIIGNNFDTSAVDQISRKADGNFVGQGTILSQTSTKIVVKQFMTGAEGAYVVKVKNADGQLSNGMDLTIDTQTNVQYQAHFAYTGWMTNWVQDEQIAGTPDGNQMEAIKIKTTGYGITYRAHVAYDGWLPWVSDGAFSGTVGEGKSLQAIQIQLQDAPSNLHVYYRVYVNGQGWQGWVSDGATAGTTGLGLAMEAIEIKIQS